MFTFGESPPPTPGPTVALPWLEWLHEQLQDALDPWINALSEHARFSRDGSDADAPEDRAVQVEILTDNDIDVRVFEAIELLTLLGGIDPGLFTRFFRLAASTERSYYWFRPIPTCAVPVTCLIRITNHNNFPAAITSWCERMVLGGVEETASTEYARVRALLESAYAMVDTATPEDVPRVRRASLVVRTEVCAFPGDFEDRVAQIAQVAVMQHAREMMASRWNPIFRVTEVSVGLPEAMSAASFLYLTTIARCGINLPRLPIYGMDVTPETAAIFAHSLQLLMATPTLGAPPNNALDQVELPVYMTERTTSAVFSALMVSSSVRSLTINTTPRAWQQEAARNRSMTRGQRDHLWRWVAFALFSRYASHRLKYIAVDLQDVGVEDIDAFRAVLDQPETVWNLPRGELVTSIEKLSASHFLLSAPLPTQPTGFETTIEFPAQVVYAEGEHNDASDGDWRRVLLPGCGPAWVRTTCANAASGHSVGSPAASLSNLYFASMSERSKPAVLELLRLIGRNIKSLSFNFFSTRDPLDDWLSAIARACPRLEDLTVGHGARITSMDVFVRMYEDFPCHLRSLRLDHIRVDHLDSIPRFMRSVGDDTTQVSKRLQEISFHMKHLQAPLVDVLPIIDATLSSNITLQNLQVYVSFQPHVFSDDDDALEALRQKHDGKLVAVRAGPLSLPQKHAFCSVLTSLESRSAWQVANTSGSKVRRVMRRLDHRAVSLIFDFAAECKKRNVLVLLYTERNQDNEHADEGDVHDNEEIEEDEDDQHEEE